MIMRKTGKEGKCLGFLCMFREKVYILTSFLQEKNDKEAWNATYFGSNGNTRLRKYHLTNFCSGIAHLSKNMSE